MPTKIYNMPKIIKNLGIKKISKKLEDYEAVKQWLYYKIINQYDMDTYLKQTRDYIGV